MTPAPGFQLHERSSPKTEPLCPGMNNLFAPPEHHQAAPVSTALSLQNAAEDILRYMRDGLKWTQIKWRLDHSGIQPPAPFKHWGRTAITKALLTTRMRRHPPLAPDTRKARS
jgi:hypothetical protein